MGRWRQRGSRLLDFLMRSPQDSKGTKALHSHANTCISIYNNSHTHALPGMALTCLFRQRSPGLYCLYYWSSRSSPSMHRSPEKQQAMHYRRCPTLSPFPPSMRTTHTHTHTRLLVCVLYTCL
jgi:hypothetical protein